MNSLQKSYPKEGELYKMATFRRGLDAEDRICTKLEGFGCRIQRDARLDHKHKLDFVITNYIDNPNFYSFGVQITTKLDVLEKQEEFLRANQVSRVTNKALYLELSDKLDLDDGGALAVLSVIMEFQFNRSYTGVRVSAARIYDDCTYQFYDLPARVKQLRERLGDPKEPQWKDGSGISNTTLQSAKVVTTASVTPIRPSVPGLAASSPVPPSAAHAHEISGTVVSYVRQGGHGIIQGEGENRYFFHISHVLDESLREQLNALPYSTSPVSIELPIVFTDAGYTKPTARYPEARSVRFKRAS